MTSEKFSKIRKSCKLHELRYFQEIHAVSDDLDALWELKCQYIMDNYVEDPAALKIYFNGCEEWIFDYLPTKQQASRYIAGELCPPFLLAQIAKKCGIKGAVEAMRNERLKDA